MAPPSLQELIGSIVAGDGAAVARCLQAAPRLATSVVEIGATRASAPEHFVIEISHYVYAGDTPLHLAAAAHRPPIVGALVAAGADVNVRNRRGARPLHYAVDGGPGSPRWDAQRATVEALLAHGADPNALDANGSSPLHRAIRSRGAAAVAALLDGGADPARPNKRGSTPLQLAEWTTGRGGSGSPMARDQQQEILRLLRSRGVDR